MRAKVSGRENISADTSYVFVANHQGAFDIFAIYGYLNHDFRWMMKKGLRGFPVIGAACAAAGHIFVDNSSPGAIRHTMEKAERVLSHGTSLVIFPEGARTFTGKMRPFKKGAFQLAMEFALPVVPVTIDGSFEVMPRTTRSALARNDTAHHPQARESAGRRVRPRPSNLGIFRGRALRSPRPPQIRQHPRGGVRNIRQHTVVI